MKKIFFILTLLVSITLSGQRFKDGYYNVPMTTAEMNAISSPQIGRVIMNSDTESEWLYTSLGWVDTGVASGSVNQVNGLDGNVVLDLSLSGNTLSLTGDPTTVDLSGLNQNASQVSIADAGGYFASGSVEGALQEIGSGGFGGGGSSTLGGLTDVTIDGTPALNELLIADGAGGWDNKTPIEGSLPYISSVSPNSNISVAAGTAAELDGLAAPGAGEIRIEFQEDQGSTATDYYVDSFTMTGLTTKTLTLGRTALPDLTVQFDAGDMLASVYDSDVNNIVDNAEQLGGVNPGSYLRSDVSDTFTGTLTVAGSINPSGTVDGRDISADGAKLDGIEAGAKDDQTASQVPIADAGGYYSGTSVEAALQEIGAGGIGGGGGAGDMLKATYDVDSDNVVDNAERLNGQLPSFYLDNTDSQTLSFSGNSISISNGNTVSLNTVNAGTLDGIDGSQFLRSDQSDTFTGSSLSFSNGSLNMTTSSNNAVYSGSQILFNSNTSSVIANTAGNSVQFSTDNATGATVSRILIPAGTNQVAIDFQNNILQDIDDITLNGQLTATAGTSSTNKDSGAIVVSNGGLGVEGNINAGGDITAFSSSDERLKYDIKTIKNPIKKLSAIRGVEYKWKGFAKMLIGKEGSDVGVIAQEVEAVMPEAVREGSHGYKQVNYEKIIPLLIEAVRAQQEEIEMLKDQVKKLKK